MTTLPDIDTSNVSFIGYWNAIDQGGADSISPSDVTTASSIQSYELYDNGIEGTILLGNGTEATFRVKTDGWLLVYLDRDHSFNQNNPQIRDNVRGWWSLIDGWAQNAPGLVTNQFSKAISSLDSELSAGTTFAHADVGLYSYEFDAATTLTALTIKVGGVGGNTDATFRYTGSTTRVAHVTAGHIAGGHSGNNMYDFAGNKLINDEGAWGSLDVLAKGQTPNPDTDYSQNLNTNNWGSDDVFGLNTIAWY